MHMHPSNHATIYFIERSLVLPIAVGVILFADVPRIPNGVMPFLFARVTVLHVLSAALLFAIWVCCFPLPSEPQSSPVNFSRRLLHNLLRVLAVTLVFGLVLLNARMTTPLVKVVTLFFVSVAILTMLRMLLIAALNSGVWGEQVNVLILGTGPIARRAWRELRTKHYRTANVIGFVDDQCHETALPEIRARHVGPIHSLESTLLKTAVDLIVTALPTKSCYDSIQSAIRIADGAQVDVLQFESIYSLSLLSQARRGDARELYSVRRVRQVAAQVFKRAFDVVNAGAGIVLLSPVLVAIAIAIKITDPGPVFFVQERYGYRRRKFKLLKFRTMVVDAEQRMNEVEPLNEADGPIFKIKNDPRITPIGRILRKTSLDELPQLWNVLSGQMSLVGPRPMSLRDVALFGQSHLMRRFSVKPGITGLWQVSGRSNTSFDHWISMDFRYIDQWSFWLDLSILARTLPVVLKGSGAM
jgi:exopolysaccharide biosynthesis polyprenyl glycosylphosphotransferase